MSYPEFREELFCALKSMIPEDVTIELLQVEKLNSCIRHGISFTKEGEFYSPTIYLEPFYHNFQNGKSIDFLARELFQCYQDETRQIPECIHKMESFECAKEAIFAKIIHVKENHRLLEDTPYLGFLDFAVVPYFEVNSEQIYKGSVLLKKYHTDFWKVSDEELLAWAIAHTKEVKGVLFRPMSEVLADYISEEDGEVFERAKDGMFVLTNTDKYFGAGVIYYPEVQGMIAEHLQEDYYLLPASVHEWVVVPESQVVDRELLFAMVRDINDSEVMEEEVLSYNIYFFSRKSQKIHIYESSKIKIY